MATTFEPDLSSEPDLSVSTATRVPTAKEYKAVDRQLGWLSVTRRSYRLLRRMARLIVPKNDESGVSISEEPGAGRGALIVRPDKRTGEGAILFIHGGGYVMGSNRDALANAIPMARELGVPVILPSYRLAPEHVFPAALDDCHAGWHWVQEQAEALGVDPAKVVVGGASAGGGHAAALVQRLHDEGGTQPVAQLLIYPMLDDRTAAKTELDKPRHRCWGNKNNRFGWSSYLGHEVGRAETAPYVVPARRDDLAGLPPAWIGVGTADVFLDEDRVYAKRLVEAGVEVSYVEAAGAIHGFDFGGTPTGLAFVDSQIEFMREYVE